MIPVEVHLNVSQSQTVFPLKVNSNSVPLSVSISTKIEKITGDKYMGDYEVIPSTETQTLNTALLSMTDNITIHPIPSNYGLIEWNGTTLFVK